MRKIHNGGNRIKQGGGKKITTEMMATNVIASRPLKGDQLRRRQLMPIFEIGQNIDM